MLSVTRNRKPCLTTWNNNRVCYVTGQEVQTWDRHKPGTVQSSDSVTLLVSLLCSSAGVSSDLSLLPFTLSACRVTVTGQITPWPCLTHERDSFLQLLDTGSSLQSNQAKLLMDSILDHQSQEGSACVLVSLNLAPWTNWLADGIAMIDF